MASALLHDRTGETTTWEGSRGINVDTETHEDLCCCGKDGRGKGRERERKNAAMRRNPNDPDNR